MISKFDIFIGESVKDFLKPKSKDEIMPKLNKLTGDKLLYALRDFGDNIKFLTKVEYDKLMNKLDKWDRGRINTRVFAIDTRYGKDWLNGCRYCNEIVPLKNMFRERQSIGNSYQSLCNCSKCGEYIIFDEEKIDTLETYLRKIRSQNESVKDQLKGKSKDDILKSIEGWTEQKKLRYGLLYNVFWLVKQSIENGANPMISLTYDLPTNKWLYSYDLAYEHNNIEMLKYLISIPKVFKYLTDEEKEKFNNKINGINESVKDHLKPKAIDDIEKLLKNYSPENKLIKGCEYGMLSVVKEALEEGADPSVYTNQPIRISCSLGYIDIVELLLKDERVDPSSFDNLSIIKSSQYGYFDIVKLLLNDHRVDPTAQHNLAIHAANVNGHKNIVDLLLNDDRVRKSLEHNKDYWVNRRKIVVNNENS